MKTLILLALGAGLAGTPAYAGPDYEEDGLTEAAVSTETAKNGDEEEEQPMIQENDADLADFVTDYIKKDVELKGAFFIEDKADLTMNLGLIGSGPPTPIAKGLLTSGKFNIKPAGVHIAAYLTQTIAGPLFAFDMNTSNFAGFDNGGWAAVTQN